MPFVLKHKEHGQIWSCMQINVYKLEYYGVKAWEDHEAAERETAVIVAGMGDKASDWELTEVEENQLKLMNVKLNNNPQRVVRLNEHGKPVAEARV